MYIYKCVNVYLCVSPCTRRRFESTHGVLSVPHATRHTHTTTATTTHNHSDDTQQRRRRQRQRHTTNQPTHTHTTKAQTQQKHRKTHRGEEERDILSYITKLIAVYYRKISSLHTKCVFSLIFTFRHTSGRKGISLHPGQNGRCTIVIENSEVRMSRYLDTSTKKRMAQLMVQYGRSSRSS